MVIQRILRYANMSTTATYYIKTAAGDVKSASKFARKTILATSIYHGGRITMFGDLPQLFCATVPRGEEQALFEDQLRVMGTRSVRRASGLVLN
jgi:hypothetical protein